MAAKGLHIDTNAFSCSICLDLLKDPVTIPCGHSYCMSCVDTHWDEEEEKQSYSCPQCRHRFTQRPVLVKNTMLAIFMEGLKKVGPPHAAVRPSPATARPSASSGDVFCDMCCGKKVRAVKSCLQCLVSYCKEHIQPHYDVAALKRHKLTDPTDNLQANICSRHDEVMKMFCRTDQQCICYLCSVDLHKGHHTVTAAAERAEKQRALQGLQQNMVHRLDHKQKDVKHLQHQVQSSRCAANAAVELCDKSLKELESMLEQRITEVKKEVKAQKKAEEYRIEELQDKVQQEISELKKTLSELDTLSDTQDHVQFLLCFASLSKVGETSVTLNSNQSPPPFQDTVTATVSKLRIALKQACLMNPPAVLPKPKSASKTDVPSTRARVAAPPQQTSQRPQHIPGAVPTTSTATSMSVYQKMEKHARRITWEPRSLNNKLILTPNNTSVTRPKRSQVLPQHELRFTEVPQVLGKETLKGQCYFELMYSSLQQGKSITIAVAYRGIRRNGSSNDCRFGMNTKSWALECFQDHSVFWHNGDQVQVASGGGLIGVYVDYPAGVLSFYRYYCSALELIYTMQTSFTQPLVAGARLDSVGSVVQFCCRTLTSPHT